jgi:hypothetical protein
MGGGRVFDGQIRQGLVADDIARTVLAQQMFAEWLQLRLTLRNRVYPAAA